jgi:hypothetical protein
MGLMCTGLFSSIAPEKNYRTKKEETKTKCSKDKYARVHPTTDNFVT